MGVGSGHGRRGLSAVGRLVNDLDPNVVTIRAAASSGFAVGLGSGLLNRVTSRYGTTSRSITAPCSCTATTAVTATATTRRSRAVGVATSLSGNVMRSGAKVFASSG